MFSLAASYVGVRGFTRAGGTHTRDGS
jgi:hypothetical protein